MTRRAASTAQSIRLLLRNDLVCVLWFAAWLCSLLGYYLLRLAGSNEASCTQASCTMPARRDRSRTPAKQKVADESVDTFELGTSVTVFWTGEKAWYDGVIDGRRKEGGRRSETPARSLRARTPSPCTRTARTHKRYAPRVHVAAWCTEWPTPTAT